MIMWNVRYVSAVLGLVPWIVLQVFCNSLMGVVDGMYCQGLGDLTDAGCNSVEL